MFLQLERNFFMNKKETSQKAKDMRARVWTMIIYPESAPKNWKDLINDKHISWCNILHDKDVNPDGTIKKAHYHVILFFDGKKSYTQIKSLTDELNAPIPQKVESPKGMVRYLIHKDNPEKYQYDKDIIETFGGVDIDDYFKMSSSTLRDTLKNINKYILHNKITSYAELTRIYMDKDQDEYDAVIHNTYLFKTIIDSIWKEEQIKLDISSKVITAKRLYKEKKDIKVIANTLGCSERTIKRYLKK